MPTKRSHARGVLALAAVLACQPWGVAQESAPELRRTESEPEAEMLAHANLYRAGLDLPALTRDAELSADCLRHALYMDRNNQTGHPEDPSLPGYSAKGHAAGMASVIAYTAPKRSVDMWMDSFLHRIPIITPVGDRAGVGWNAGKAVTSALLDTRRGADASRGRDAELHWPPDGMIGVPTSMSREQPNPTPYPSSDQAGYPVTCTFHANTRVTQSKGTLFQGGAEVPVFFSSPDQPTRHGQGMQQNTIALIPEKNLSSGKLHRVELSATVNGQPWTATWVFTTGARGKGFEWILERSKDARMRAALEAKKTAQDESRTGRDAQKSLALAKGTLRAVPDSALGKAIAEARATRARLPGALQEELDAALAKAEKKLTANVDALVAQSRRQTSANQFDAALQSLAEAGGMAAGLAPWAERLANERRTVDAAKRAAAGEAAAAKGSGATDSNAGASEPGWTNLLEGGTPNNAWSTPIAPAQYWKTTGGALHLDAKDVLLTLGYLYLTDDWKDYELKAEVQVTKGAQVICRAGVKDGDYVGAYVDLKPTPAGEWKTLHVTLSGDKVKMTLGDQTFEDEVKEPSGGFVFFVDEGEKLVLKNVRVKRPKKMR